jgi:hypothetical protein
MDGLPGCRVTSFVMDSDTLGGRVTGYRDPCKLRCPKWTGYRMAGLPDGRVVGCRVLCGLRCPGWSGGRVLSLGMDSNALDGWVTGYRNPRGL